MKIVTATSHRSKILVVEDDDDLRSLLQALLERHFFDVEVADSGLNALARLSSFKPDLILLDLAMPDMDGFTFLERKNTNAQIQDIPVIVLTARDSNRDVMRALDLGAQNYITKPFDNANLLARIGRLIGGPRTGQVQSSQVSW